MTPPEIDALLARLETRAASFRKTAATECAEDVVCPPEPEDDGYSYCTACASNGVSAILMEDAAALIRDLVSQRDEARQKLNHWHRRAQKAETELCVTAEERARQGMSIGRALAGATWLHYKDRAERAEAERDAARTALAQRGETPCS